MRDRDDAKDRHSFGITGPFYWVSAAVQSAVKGRARKRLGRAAGLTQFGVNICTLKSGAASSHRHWHENEDEFVYMLSGEAVLVEDGEETVLKAGDAAAWKAGIPNGHCLINRSDGDAVFIEVGTRAASERAHYPDVDLKAERDGSQARYTRRDGTPVLTDLAPDEVPALRRCRRTGRRAHASRCDGDIIGRSGVTGALLTFCWKCTAASA